MSARRIFRSAAFTALFRYVCGSRCNVGSLFVDFDLADESLNGSIVNLGVLFFCDNFDTLVLIILLMQENKCFFFSLRDIKLRLSHKSKNIHEVFVKR